MTQVMTSDPQALKQSIVDAIQHLDHVLPGQAPIHDFVHHNTLHGFQHLPFEQALAEFSALTGIDCYLPAEQFRGFYKQGRIADADIDAVLAEQFGFSETAGDRQRLYRLALLCDLAPISPAQWHWHVQELDLFGDPASKRLWQSLMEKLDIRAPELHPEQLLDLSEEQLESWPDSHSHSMQLQTKQDIAAFFAQVGDRLTLRGLLQALTGIDILDSVRPQLIRLGASVLDEGQAAWRLPERQSLGLYQAWLRCADFDLLPAFQEIPDWQTLKAALPEDAVDAIMQQLQALGIPPARWPGYLRRLALELPGWSGLINWRQTHPSYQADDATKPQLADYLAIRLFLDRLQLHAVCREQWRCQAGLDKLLTYFDKHAAEFAVRQALFNGGLPEYLAQSAHALLANFATSPAAWQALAERIWTWRHSPLADRKDQPSAFNHGWRLFRLCKELGLTAADIQALDKEQLMSWLNIIDGFGEAERSRVWLEAYERHYQQDLLQALYANRGRGRWAQREQRPEAQIIFCMDDREEGIRRHLEELNPRIETLGAAGFFGVPMNYQGLDDSKPTPLCPVVVVPSHEVRELSQHASLQGHRRGNKLKQDMAYLLHHGLRRDALLSMPLIHAVAPLALGGLLLKSLFPKSQQNLLAAAAAAVVPEIDTRLQFTASDDDGPATPEQPRLGFTDREQAERVAAFLRNTGLTYGFAELVVLMGHGSMSQNNPHLAAYDCGACSGRHGGPNARLFAAMANRPQVRKLLAERGIAVPDDTWFVGAEHNTCDEGIAWYDLADVPAARQAALAKFSGEMAHAQRMSAHERCRRLASAPRKPSPRQALKHFLNRAGDFSQARPELGHATNAAALVGRRSLSQGAFFDRRLFLISYDPTQDPDGKTLEGLLLAVGPVGAGINLEYYFSTVNNERLGCGSKVPHNLTGFCAVMEGAGSDLRTGLPKQMIEIHEAMRLQLVVEAKTAVLEQIYAGQPSIRELVGGGWLHLSAKDPDNGEIFVFRRGVGFVPWQAQDRALPLRKNSPDCYRDETLPVPPMLIEQPVLAAAASR
ncbi:DUF2309 domain-containing protein [Methylomonas sp. MgM2]